jgi:hypothetical protein
MLGHATVAFTLDVYSHVTATMQKEAAETMNNLLGLRWDAGWGQPHHLRPVAQRQMGPT